MAIPSKSAPAKTRAKPEKAAKRKSRKPIAYENPLRYLDEGAFANLGLGEVVYMRTISALELQKFIPEAKSMPSDVQFQMIVGADGTPVLITDSFDATQDWFSQNEVETLPRH